MTKRLLEPILEGGIRHVHFFNGRRLTAEDLQTEQAAGRQARERLGLGIGSGIVAGFEVTETAQRLSSDARPGVVLKVRAGTAINGLGQTLALGQDQDVELVAPEETVSADAGLFGPCEGATSVTIGTGSGAYILVATPVSGFEGRAPMSGFDYGGRVTGCASRYSVAGVRFRVVPLQLPGGVGAPGTLRNRLAHHCFGTEALLASYRVPPEGPGGDRLSKAAPDLDPCDVPLALLYWSDGGIQFIDAWSVRRRVSAPFPASEWLSFASDQRKAVAEALFLQFQDQIDWLVERETGLKSMDAAARFRYLPPAGFLPVGHNEFDVAAFFRRDRFQRQIELEGDPTFLRAWVHIASYIDPIDVNDPPPIVIYHLPGLSDYVFFMRHEATRLSGPPQEVLELLRDEPESVATGAIEVDLALAEGRGAPADESGALAEESGGLRIRTNIHALLSFLGKTEQAALARGIKVTATDEVGNTYEGTMSIPGSVMQITTGKRFARSIIDSLEPGTYKVSVQSKFFRTASRIVDLREGARERVLFQLIPQEKEVSTQTGVTLLPAKTAKADWMEHEWYDKMAVMEAYINPNRLPEEVQTWDLVTDPPPHVKEWLVSWADWTATRMPNAAVDPGDVRILVRPDYVPSTVSDEPYAYIEFGKNGAHVPIVMVPNHTALDTPVSLQSAEVTGIDQDVGMRLWQLGAGEVDIAAAAWTGVLRDVGFSGETAVSILEEARNKAVDLKTSVKAVPGVDAKIGAVLEDKGIDSAVKLANADPARLKEELGIDDLAAKVVVEEARKVVPEEAWSLKSRDLGLSETQVKALEEIGVTTKGDLAQKSAEEISEKVGVAVKDAGSILEKTTQAIDEKSIKAKVIEKTPVAALKESEDVALDADLAKSLAKSGVKHLKDVAETDVDRLAALTGDRKTAEGLINAAKARIGLVR